MSDPLKLNYYAFDPPTLMRMGMMGDEPILAGCADCGKEVPIAGKLASGPSQIETGVIQTTNGFKLAYFCVPCYAHRLSDQVTGRDTDHPIAVGRIVAIEMNHQIRSGDDR